MYSKEDSKKIYKELNNILIEAKDLDELMGFSDNILLVEVNNDFKLIGNGIVNNCTVKKIYKTSTDIKKNDRINIYDLSDSWNKNSTRYFGGITPMKEGESYIVFLKKAKNPSVKDSYVFSSIMFGHTNINSATPYLLNYEQYSLSIENIKQYDYIFSKESTEEDVLFYESIRNQIMKLVTR